MKVIAMLNWFAEDPEWLYKGITSLAKVPIDVLVAADGAYALYPDGAPSSPIEQHDAIYSACAAIDAEPYIHTPESLWQGGEVEKRTHLFRMAERHATPHEDWYLIWDADEVLGRANDIKPRLQATDLDCADLTAIERPGPDAPTATASRFPTRKFYRAIPGIHVDGNHYTYRTPDGRYLWGNQNQVTLEEGLDLKDVQLAHRTNLRNKHRRIKALLYYEQRDRAAAEMLPCAVCGEQATCTMKVNHTIERLNGGLHIASGMMDVCDRCFPKQDSKTKREVQLLVERYCRQHGIDPAKLRLGGDKGFAMLQ